MASLRDALERLGFARTRSYSFRNDLSVVRPRSLAALLRAGADPQLESWEVIEKSTVENLDFSEEAQGAVFDGVNWFITSNGDDIRDGLYKLSEGLVPIDKIGCPVADKVQLHAVAMSLVAVTTPVHIGSLCVHDGWVYVPTQKPFGVWKVSTDFTRSFWLAALDPPEPDMFAWCDVHTANGLLYTANYRSPTTLWAYDASAGTGGNLPRVAAADIPIVQSTVAATTNVQSACFTPNLRILMICDVGKAERIHCHSVLTGGFMGQRGFLAEAGEEWALERNELEGISLANLLVKGVWTQVQVLELNNDTGSGDDFYLWHVKVPRPDLPLPRTPTRPSTSHWQAEARIASTIGHPNIIKVFDAGQLLDAGCSW